MVLVKDRIESVKQSSNLVEDTPLNIAVPIL